MSPLEPTQALTLFGVVAALLVLLFLIRRRAKRVVVPSLQPWRLVINRRVNPLWKQLLSLALQLLAAALACWALVPEYFGMHEARNMLGLSYDDCYKNLFCQILAI